MSPGLDASEGRRALSSSLFAKRPEYDVGGFEAGEVLLSGDQVGVAKENLTVTRETLVLTRQRFQAGVSDNVEVVQAQESLASAELDYINSVFAHNVAKLSLARAIGAPPDNLSQWVKLR